MAETNHSLHVSVDVGDLRPCGRGTGECELWGAGVLRLMTYADKYVASTVLTAAGCEVCPNPKLKQSDLRLIDSHESDLGQDGSIPIDIEVQLAHNLIAHQVEKFPKTNTPH